MPCFLLLLVCIESVRHTYNTVRECYPTTTITITTPYHSLSGFLLLLCPILSCLLSCLLSCSYLPVSYPVSMVQLSDQDPLPSYIHTLSTVLRLSPPSLSFPSSIFFFLFSFFSLSFCLHLIPSFVPASHIHTYIRTSIHPSIHHLAYIYSIAPSPSTVFCFVYVECLFLLVFLFIAPLRAFDDLPRLTIPPSPRLAYTYGFLFLLPHDLLRDP